MATHGMIELMERHLHDTNLNLILRLFAGMFLMMAFGCLRWSDAQRSEELCIYEDARIGVCWRMKKKATKIPYGIPRLSYIGFDWGATFHELLTCVSLPGVDYILPKPKPDFLGLGY
jgi:hypothetical protein